MNELTPVGAFFIGFLGSTHCLGMCGGLAAAIGYNKSGLGRVVTYNLGRLLTYSALGVLAGLLGTGIVNVTPQLGVVLRVAAGLLLVAMGLYVSQWWMGLTRLEQVGASLWARIQPITRGLLPMEHLWQALALGCLWGLLPCGLVYSTLSWAMATADWRQSGLFMLAFGLGTLPAMIGVGLVNQALFNRLRQRDFRALAGVFIIVMGLWTIAKPVLHVAHLTSEHARQTGQGVQNEKQHHH